jgi:hypothetical protein
LKIINCNRKIRGRRGRRCLPGEEGATAFNHPKLRETHKEGDELALGVGGGGRGVREHGEARKSVRNLAAVDLGGDHQEFSAAVHHNLYHLWLQR